MPLLRPLLLVALLVCPVGCKKKGGDSTADTPSGGSPAAPPVGWSAQEIDLPRLDTTSGPSRMYVGGKPKYYTHAMDPDHDRLDQRLQRRGNTVANFWAWEEGQRVYAVMWETAVIGIEPPPPLADQAKMHVDGFLSNAQLTGLRVVSQKPVTHRGMSGVEAVLEGRGLRIVARLLVNPAAKRQYIIQASALLQSDPIDATDPKVRAFLDNSEVGPVK